MHEMGIVEHKVEVVQLVVTKDHVVVIVNHMAVMAGRALKIQNMSL